MFGFGRKGNRRRVESRLSRLRLPSFAGPWRARLRTAFAVAIAVGDLDGPLQCSQFHGRSVEPGQSSSSATCTALS